LLKLKRYLLVRQEKELAVKNQNVSPPPN